GMAPRELADRLAVLAQGGHRLGIGNEGPRHPLVDRPVQAEHTKRVRMVARDDRGNIAFAGLPDFVAHEAPTSLTGAYQISSAYWRRVRSEENQPTCAVLRTALAYQSRG